MSLDIEQLENFLLKLAIPHWELIVKGFKNFQEVLWSEWKTPDLGFQVFSAKTITLNM